jgi:hypothetical protein
MILIDHEDNFYGKGFMINSKKHPINIIALQYELVYPGSIATHIKENNREKSNVLWRPLPDLKLAGGDYIRRTLMRVGNYPV